MTQAEYADRVRAWAGELRSGSTQTWSEFLAGPGGSGAPLEDGPLPTAAQLELVRRLSGSVPDLSDRVGLADLVLNTAGVGRGLVDTPPPWGSPQAIGSPAVQPEDLPADELLRVAAGVLVRLLAAEPRTPLARTPRSPRSPRSWRRWRRPVTLLGAPTTVELVRSALLARGLREGGGSGSTWFVLGGSLEDMMAQRWAARVRAGAGMRWQRMWRTAAANDRVPPGIALPTIANHLAEQIAPGRVHVVLAPDATASLALVGEVLGIPGQPLTDRYDVLATDLLRRVNPMLTLAIGEEARRQVVTRVWSEIAAGEVSGPLGAPLRHLDWAAATGERMALALAGARYAVHGDPALVVPTRRPGVRRAPDPDDVLAHALQVVGRAWRRSRERGEP